MAKTLVNYYKNHSHKFKTNLRKLSENPDDEIVHDLRVAVKRIRTVYLLLQHLSPDEFDAKSMGAKFRILFKLSGNLRDTQIQISILERYSNQTNQHYTHYLLFLKKQENKTLHKLDQYLKQVDFNEMIITNLNIEHYLIQKGTEKEILEMIDQLITDLMIQSAGLHKDNIEEDDLHLIRRYVKQCQYLLAIAKSITETEHDVYAKKLKIVSHAGELLGNWHDIEVGIHQLELFRLESNQADYYYEKYRDLNVKMNEELNKWLEQVHIYLKFVIEVFLNGNKASGYR